MGSGKRQTANGQMNNERRKGSALGQRIHETTSNGCFQLPNGSPPTRRNHPKYDDRAHAAHATFCPMPRSMRGPISIGACCCSCQSMGWWSVFHRPIERHPPKDTRHSRLIGDAASSRRHTHLSSNRRVRTHARSRRPEIKKRGTDRQAGVPMASRFLLRTALSRAGGRSIAASSFQASSSFGGGGGVQIRRSLSSPPPAGAAAVSAPPSKALLDMLVCPLTKVRE